VKIGKMLLNYPDILLKTAFHPIILPIIKLGKIFLGNNGKPQTLCSIEL